MGNTSGFKLKSGNWKRNWKLARILHSDLWRFVFVIVLLIALCWLSNDLKVTKLLVDDNHFNITKNAGLVVALQNINSDDFQKEELIWQNNDVLQIKEVFSGDFFDSTVALGEYSKEMDNFKNLVSGDDQIIVRLPKRYENAVNISKNDLDVSIFPLFVNTQNSEASIDNERLIYDEVYPYVSVIREIKEDGWKEYLLIKDEQAPKMYDCHVVINNGSLRLDNDGVIRISSLQGRDVMKFRNIQAWNADMEDVSDLVKYDLQNNGILEIKINSDQRLRYPLLIDPGVKI